MHTEIIKKLVAIYRQYRGKFLNRVDMVRNICICYLLVQSHQDFQDFPVNHQFRVSRVIQAFQEGLQFPAVLDFLVVPAVRLHLEDPFVLELLAVLVGLDFLCRPEVLPNQVLLDFLVGLENLVVL